MFGFGMPELIILMVILAGPILWIIALVDAIKSDFEANNKILWILLIVFIPFIGSILYLTIGRGQRNNNLKFQPKSCSCGAAISTSASFCSQCGGNLN